MPSFSIRRSGLAALTAALALTMAPDAHACSCAGAPPKKILKRADAAFVGRVVSVVRSKPGERARSSFVFSVQRDFKRNLGQRVTAVGRFPGSSCDLLGLQVGDRIGLFLFGKERPWRIGACNTFDPSELKRGVDRLPRPQSKEPMRFLMGGFGKGSARVVALDRRGRTVAYGPGRGTVTRIAVCPRGHRSVEVVADRRGTRLAIRRLPSLTVTREIPLHLEDFPRPSTRAVGALRCNERRAREVVMLAQHSEGESGPSRLLRLRGSRREVIQRGRAQSAALTAGTAYVDHDGRRLLRVDLRTGRARVLAGGLNGISGLSLSPDRKFLAGVADGQSGRDIDGPDTTEALLFRLGDRPSQVAAYGLGSSGGHGHTVWLGAQRVAYVPTCCGDDAVLFAGLLNRLRAFTWPAGAGVVVGGALFGVADDELWTATVTGRSRVLRTLYARPTAPLVALPSPLRARRSARCLRAR